MQEISHGGYYEMPFEPFCAVMYEDFAWLLDEKFISIEGLSFVGMQFNKEIKPKLLSIADPKAKKVLEKNSFGYKDFFLFEKYFKQLLNEKKIPVSIVMHSQGLRDYLKDPESKIKVLDKEKILKYLESYSKIVVQEIKIITGREQVSLKEFFTIELLNKEYAEYCKRENGKYYYPNGSEDAIKECLTSEIRTVQDSAIFDHPQLSLLPPAMYYLELEGLVEIIEMEEDERGYFDIRYKLTNNSNQKFISSSIFLIECTEKNKIGVFKIYINERRENPIVVSYGRHYARVIYDIAEKGFCVFVGLKEKKRILDYVRDFVKRKIPNEFSESKIVQSKSGKFYPASGVEIKMSS